MIADFYDSFGKDTGTNKEIPAEVLELLNSDLPDNFMYVNDSEGGYMAVPRPDKLTEGLRLTTQFDFDVERDSKLIERLGILPQEKWAEYFYRLQRVIPVKNLRVGNEAKTIPLERTIGNPLQERGTIVTDTKMYPESFPDPITIVFESIQGDTIPIKLQQQVYDSLAEIKLQNINFPALKIELYRYAPLVEDLSQEESHTSPDVPLRLTYSVQPALAKTVTDAVAALRVFKGLIEGTIKMNGKVIPPKGIDATLTPQQIDEAIGFWSTALALEEKLKVKFVPSADFPMEDIKLFNELKVCLIDGQEIVWKHPFDHFHMGGYHPVDKDYRFEDFIGKENMAYRFTEGPIEATLLGTEFNIYSRSEIKDFVITNIDWDDESKEGGDVYIADAPGKVLTLSRLYITEEDIAAETA